MPASKTSRVIGDLWDRLWAAGVTDSVSAIEQVGYLLLLKKIDREYPVEAGPGPFEDFPRLRWQRLMNAPTQERFGLLEHSLIPFVTSAIHSASFIEALRGAELRLPTPGVLADCMTLVEELFDQEEGGSEVSGEAFDALLERLQLDGRDGAFMTPRHLVRAMIELLAPEPGEVICDPAAGSGGFLVEAYRTMSAKTTEPISGNEISGVDINPAMVRLAALNLALHGIDRPAVSYGNWLSAEARLRVADVVVTNPPFGARVDSREVAAEFGIDSNRTDVLFLELCRRLLRPWGRAAIVVPQGLLFGEARAEIEVRRSWLTRARVDAVISLPSTTFRPSTSIQTAIILGGAAGPTDQVLFCEIGEADDLTENLDYLARAIHARLKGKRPRAAAARAIAERCWPVSIEEIAEKSWSLAAASYEPGTGAEPGSVVDPWEVLADVERLESEFQQRLSEARELLGRRP